MSPFELFHPSVALDPEQAGAAKLLEAARHFPGGPAMLVFALFWAPVGPGIPAGVLLARHIPLSPMVTFSLYAVSDVLGALVCHPIFLLLRRAGRRLPRLRWLGRRMMGFAMMGVPAEGGDARNAPTLAPALSRIATVGFGADVYTGGLLATGLAVPRLAGWAAAIAGDLFWFALLLGTSIVAASVATDDRFIGLVVVLAMIFIPRIARRFVPALRGPARGR